MTEIALFGAIFFFCHPLVAQDIEGEIEQMAVVAVVMHKATVAGASLDELFQPRGVGQLQRIRLQIRRA